MKKTTFFLALILTAVFIYFLANSSTKYNLTEKFNIHGRVIDYGTYSSENYEELKNNIDRIYLEYSKQDKDVYFVFGNEKEINVANYENINKGEMSIVTGNINQKFDLKEEEYTLRKIVPTSNRVEIFVDGKEYEFNLKSGENIFFIIEG